MSSVPQLMKVQPADRRLDWLKLSLQCALVLEHSTLPPYLCALWSIKNPQHYAYDMLKRIAYQEMVHFGLACNLLSGIGGSPVIRASEVVPKYPGPLPCDVKPLPNPNLIVSLGRLTPERVSDVFMAIEYPEHGPVAEAARRQYHSIGEFYGAIRDCFRDLRPSLSLDHQLEYAIIPNDLVVTKITTIEQALKAIDLIVEQGEGTDRTPDAPDFGHELAHYYKFKQLQVRRRYRQVGERWELTGEVLQFPEVYPMADVPAGGYPPDPNAPSELADFNKSYGSMLDELQAAWDGGGSGRLDAAVSSMVDMASYAQTLMSTKPLPDNSGLYYGPTFRV